MASLEGAFLKGSARLGHWRVLARHGGAGEKAAQLGSSQSPLQVFVSRKYGEGG